MSLKARLISSVSMFVLVLALLVVSVFALRQERLSLGGTISFQATSVYAKVSGTVSGMNENSTTLPTLIFSEGEDATPETDMEIWNALNLVFSGSGEPIKISLTVENLSEELSLGVSITNQIASIENVNISITKGEEEATSAIVAPAESATFVLTISLKDTSVSVPETSYDFLINLTEASQMREINVYSNVEGTNVSGSGLYAIGDTVSITMSYDSSADALPLGIASDSNYENFVYKIGMEEYIEQNPSYEFVLTEDSPTDYYCFYHDFDSPTYKDTNTESPTYGFVFAYSGDFAIVVDGLRSQGQELENVTHLDFPNTVTIEGNQYKVIGAVLTDGSPMQHYPNLESIYIPENFQLFVGVPIKYGLTKLTKITVSPENNSFSDMGMNVLYDKVSKTVLSGCSTSEIPEEATKIGDYAFYECSSLTSVSLPTTLTSIGSSAFSACYALAIVYNNSSLNITAGSFDYGGVGYYAKEVVTSGEKAVGEIVVEGNVQYYVTTEENIALAPSVPKGSLTSVTIREGTTEINQHAFSNCSSLTEITIQESVTSIGERAFSGCSSLTEITIPEGVTSIGNSAFYNCSSLTEITISEGVTSISNSAFYNCSSLTEITLPSTLTSIDAYAFSDCSGLTQITINGDISTLGSWAFQRCTNLTKLTLGAGVTSIPNNLFTDYNLIKLTEIEVLGNLNSTTFPSGT